MMTRTVTRRLAMWFLTMVAIMGFVPKEGHGQAPLFKVVRKTVIYDKTASASGGIVRMPNGELLATYHTYYNNSLYTIRSRDNGKTWGQIQHVIQGAAGALGITTLKSGTILWPFFQEFVKEPCCEVRRVTAYVYRSTDNGATWQGDAPIATSMREAVPYGRIVELSDGRLLMPVWGAYRLGERWQSGTFESVDGGKTWDHYTRIGYDPEAGCRPDNGFNETSIAEMPDHTLVAILREQRVGTRDHSPEAGPCDHYTEPINVHFYRAVSHDLGETWSRPVRLSLIGTSPSLHLLPDGTLLLGYRASPQHLTESGHYGISVRVSQDQGKTWVNEVPLQDPKGYRFGKAGPHPGYPDFVDIPGGDVLVVFRSVQILNGRRGLYVAANLLHQVH